MNRQRNNQFGFSIVEVLLVLVVIGVIGFAGFYVLNKQDNKSDPNQTVPETSQQEEINNADDLQTSEDNLNDINVDELDITELDAAEADLL